MAGIANAAGIPIATDPANAPEIWTVEVYNDSSSALTSGTVVEWDMDNDTTDASYAYRTMWVEIGSTADDILVAGVVVDDSIAANSVGTIAIWGPVYAKCADSTDAVTAAQSVAISAVAGQAGQSCAAAVNKGILGFCIYAAPVSSAYGGYDATDGQDGIMLPIFVNVSNN